MGTEHLGDTRKDTSEAPQLNALFVIVPGTRAAPSTVSYLKNALPLFDDEVTQQEIMQLISDVMESAYDPKIQLSGPSKLITMTRNIALGETSTLLEEKKQKLLMMAQQVTFLAPVINILLQPEFYHHVDAYQAQRDRKTQQHATQNTTSPVPIEAYTLLQYITSSPLWGIQETIELQRYAAEQKRAIASRLMGALSHNDWTPTLENVRTMFALVQKEVRDNPTLFYDGKDALCKEALQDFMRIPVLDFYKDNNKEQPIYTMTLGASENIYNFIEENPTGKTLKNVITYMKDRIQKHCNITFNWEYRMPVLSESSKKKNTQQLEIAASVPTVPKDITSLTPFLAGLYKKYGVQMSLPRINPQTYFEEYIAHEKDLHPERTEDEISNYRATLFAKRDQSIVPSKNGAPTLCVSQENNFSFLFASLSHWQAYYERMHKEKRLCRMIEAKQLIALNKLSTQMYATGDKAPSPFYSLLNATHKLIVTGAEDFLSGNAQGTLAQLVNHKSVASIILLSTIGDTSKVEEIHYASSDKDKEKPIVVQRALETNKVYLESPHAEHVQKNMKFSIESRAEQLTLFENPLKRELTYSTEFYTAVQAMAGADASFRMDLEEWIAKNHALYPDDLTMLTSLYTHFKKYIVAPIPLSLDESYQIVADYVLKYIHITHPELFVTDAITEEYIVMYMSYIYLQKHKETAHFTHATARDIDEYLKRTLKHPNLSSIAKVEKYGKEKLGSNTPLVIALCETMNQQLIHKLLTKTINASISPTHTTPKEFL